MTDRVIHSEQHIDMEKGEIVGFTIIESYDPQVKAMRVLKTLGKQVLDWPIGFGKGGALRFAQMQSTPPRSGMSYVANARLMQKYMGDSPPTGRTALNVLIRSLFRSQ